MKGFLYTIIIYCSLSFVAWGAASFSAEDQTERFALRTRAILMATIVFLAQTRLDALTPEKES